MDKRVLVIALTALIVLPLGAIGCKGRVKKEPQMGEEPFATQEEAAMVTTAEPGQVVVTETIPPTAAPQGALERAGSAAVPQGKLDRNIQIQKVLASTGFYSGPIDGRIGPKTRRAIADFQRSKGLKVDGKVGPKTWQEMEKYLGQ